MKKTHLESNPGNIPYLDHFLPLNVSISVNIEKVKAPENFLLSGSFAHDGQELHKVSKGDSSWNRLNYIHFTELKL